MWFLISWSSIIYAASNRLGLWGTMLIQHFWVLFAKNVSTFRNRLIFRKEFWFQYFFRGVEVPMPEASCELPWFLRPLGLAFRWEQSSFVYGSAVVNEEGCWAEPQDAYHGQVHALEVFNRHEEGQERKKTCRHAIVASYNGTGYGCDHLWQARRARNFYSAMLLYPAELGPCLFKHLGRRWPPYHAMKLPGIQSGKETNLQIGLQKRVPARILSNMGARCNISRKETRLRLISSDV